MRAAAAPPAAGAAAQSGGGASAAAGGEGCAICLDALQQPQTMPNIPDLRSYEENKEFMEDLKQGIPPVEVWLAAPSWRAAMDPS